jgi:hypothetical protein
VPTKTKAKSPTRPRRASTKPAAKPIQSVVRRGALRRFDSLKRATAELPVTLTWDRRVAERRSPEGSTTEERRKGDRRQKPQFTWELADFVVIEPAVNPPADPQPAKTKKKR